jgi:endonuclease-3
MMTFRRLSIAQLCRRLRTAHGPVEPWERLPPLDELIATILAQNTSNANSDAAFARLKSRFPSWEKLRTAQTRSIAAAIRVAGLSRLKAPRIRAILEQLYQQRRMLSLDFLCELPDHEALKYLRGLKGVGPKTAACVLLFACHKPILPVNTQVHRVARRLGLIGPQTSAEKAHELLAKIVPKRLVLEFHVNFIRHGRAICLPRKPRCTDCVLLDACPDGWRRMGINK